MDRPTLSVLTLIKNREPHLRNLITGLSQGTLQSDELIVVRMNEPVCSLPDTSFPCRQVQLSTAPLLPLAHARNVAASAANGGVLIFLDVDCIPGTHCLEEFIRAYGYAAKAVLLGGVYFLKNPVSSAWTEAVLKKQAAAHPLRDPKQQTFLQQT